MTPRLASGREDGQPEEQCDRGRDERGGGGDRGEDLTVAERARDAGARLALRAPRRRRRSPSPVARVRVGAPRASKWTRRGVSAGRTDSLNEGR